MKDSKFRTWLKEKWYEHCLEIETWTGKLPTYPDKEYFRKYRWWLKAMYRKVQ